MGEERATAMAAVEEQAPNLPAIVMPRGGVEAAIAMHDRFVELKSALIEKVGGIDKIAGKPYVNRKGWIATSTVFDLNLSVVESGVRTVEAADATRPACKQAWVRVRAWKGMRSFEAEGVCDTSEDWSRRGNFAPEGEEGAASLIRRVKRGSGYEYERSWHFPKTWNALVSFAQTRAINRAVGCLLGLAVVSAEEVIGAEDTGEDDDVAERERKGAANVGRAPQPGKPVTVSGEAPPRDVVGDVFKLGDKLVALVGSDEAKKAWGRAVKSAGIAHGVSLYKSTKTPPDATLATKEEQVAFWRAYKAEVVAAEERVAGIAGRADVREAPSDDFTPSDEKGVVG